MTEAWAEFERWEERTLQKGRKEGKQDGLRTAIAAVCELLEIPMDATRQARLAQLDAAGLERLLTQLKQHRAWPA